MDKVRKIIKDRIEELGMYYSEVSNKIGRNHSYIQQYLDRQVPKELPEKTRKALAEVLKIEESLIGGPEENNSSKSLNINHNTVDIPEYDIFNVRKEDHILYRWQFPREYFVKINTDPNYIFIIEIPDEAMSPTISAGEKVMINESQKNLRADGVYALEEGGSIIVRRISSIPGNSAEIMVICDNEKFREHKVQLSKLKAIGKIVWAARTIK